MIKKNKEKDHGIRDYTWYSSLIILDIIIFSAVVGHNSL